MSFKISANLLPHKYDYAFNVLRSKDSFCEEEKPLKQGFERERFIGLAGYALALRMIGTLGFSQSVVK